MDYEDNDFQSQSFQLAVEENITFSPGPHSYSLPKFDLDDNLQVHLRFDSLVESEVLFGIQSQEENRWIEDYSRESSGLEFSSGAAEACSISRCNNVWSEVTSSESVALLLKSVGQDEMIIGQAMIEESDNCDRLGSLENQMKPSLNQEGFTVYKTETAPCVGSMSTLDEPGEQSSRLDKDDVDHLPQVDFTSQTGESGCLVKNENSKVTGLKEDVNAINKFEGNKDDVDHLPQVDFTSQTGESGCLVKNENSKVTGLKEDVNAINKFEGNKSHIDSFRECIQVKSCTASVQNSANIVELNSDVPQRDECLEKDDAEISIVKQVLTNSQTHESHLADPDDDNGGNISRFIQKVGSMPHVTESSSEAIFTRHTAQIGEYEHTISSESADTVDHFIGYLPKASPFMAYGENICVAPPAAISVGTMEDLSIPNTHKSDQTTHGYGNVGAVAEQEDLSKDVDPQLDDRISISDTERLSMKEKISQGQGNEESNYHIGDPFNLVVETCSSTHISNEPQSDDRKDMHKDVEVHISVDCCSSSLLVQSQQICAQMLTNTGSNVDYLNCPNASTHEKKTGRFSTDSGLSGVIPEVVDMESDKIVDDVDCPDASTAARFLTDSESSGVVAEIVNVASDKILDGVHNVLLRSNIANHEATQDKKGLDSPSDVHSSISLEQEKTGTTVPLLDAKETYQISCERVTSPESEHCKVSDKSIEMAAGIVGQSTSSMVSLGKMCQNEQASDVAKTDSQPQCSAGLKERSVISDAALKEKECVEICEKYMMEVPMEAEVIKPSHDETSGQPLPPPLEESSHHIDVNDLENNRASEINTGVGTVLASTEGLHPNHEETPRHPLPPSLPEPSHDIVVKDVENNEASETNSGVQTAFAVTEAVSQNGLEGTCGPAAMSEGDVVEAESYSCHSNEPSRASPTVISCNEASHSEKNHEQRSTVSADNIDADYLEQEVNKVHEANCGSPTIISCNETSQSDKISRERSMVSVDHSDSDSLEKGANSVRRGAVDPKENDAFEDDRSFSFKVLGSSTSASVLDPKLSDDITDVNPQISGETNASKSTEHKSGPMDQNTTNEEIAGEGNPQNNEQYGGKEHRVRVGRLDQNTAVSSNMEQLAVVDGLTVQDPKENIAAEVDRNVAIEANQIADPSEKETGSKWKEVHSIQPSEFVQTVGLSPPTSFTCQIDAKVSQDIPREFHPIAMDATNAPQSLDGSAGYKTKLSSAKTSKENDNERDVIEKTFSMKHTEAGRSNSSCTSPISPASVAQVVQAGELQAVGFMQGSAIKSSAVSTAQTSNLPDLNSLSSSQTLFQPSFTDFQQVQLRAQIFVYGSIIQGTAPDEACMQAAFGESDGGRREWEKVWRIAVERLHNQKSPLSNSKTPLSNSKTPMHLNTGARVSEAKRQTVHRSEAVCTPGGAESTKFSPVVLNPNMPFSSPIWTTAAYRDGQLSTSMPKGPLVDSSQKFLPLHPLQSPHMRHYIGNTSSWMTQMPSPGTWFVNQNAALDASIHHTTLPICETVRVTSVRESSAPHCSGKQHVLPNSVIHNGTPSSAVRKSLVMDAKRTTVSPAKQASTESKPRKKRRNVASEVSGKISFGQSQTDPISGTQSLASFATTTIVSGMNDVSSAAVSGSSLVSTPMNILSQLPTFVATTTTTSAMSVASGGFISGSSPVSFAMKDAAQLTSSVATSTVTSSVNVASGSLTSGNSLVSSAHDKILSLGETELRVAFSEMARDGIEQAKRHAEEAAAVAATAVRHCQSIWSQLSIQRNSGIVSEIQAKVGSSAVAIAAAASVAKAAAAVAQVASDAALEAKLMADEALDACKSGNLSLENSLCDDAKNLGKVTPPSILKGRSKINNADAVLVSVREAAKKRVEAASAAAKRAENLDSVLKAAEMTAEAVSQAGTIIAMGEPLPFTLPELIDAGPEGHWKVHQKSSEQLVKSNNVLPEETSKDGVKEGSVGSVEQFNEQLSNKNDVRKTVKSSKESAENRMLFFNGLQSGSVSPSGKGSGSQKDCTQNELSKTIGVTPESQVVSENAATSMQNEEVQGHQLVSTSNSNKFEDGSLVEVRSNEEGLQTVWFSAKVLSSKDGKALVSYTEHAHHEGTSQHSEWVPLEGKEDNAPRIRFPHPMSVIKYDGTRKRNREARGDYTWSVGDKVDAWISNGWREGIINEKSKEDETNLTVHFPAQQETSVVRAWDLRPSLFWEDGKWIEWCRPGGSGCLSHERKPPKKSKLEDEAKRKDKTTKIPSIMEGKKPEAQKPLMLSAKEKVFNAGKNSSKDVLGKKPAGLQKESSSVNLNAPKPGKKRKFMDVSKFSKPSILKSEKSKALASVSSRDVASDSLSSKRKPSSDVASDSLSSKRKPSSDVASDSLSSKRKPSSDVAANLQRKGKTSHLAEKLVKNNEKGAGHDYLVNSTPSSVEPRRSNRKIQPTSRLLEGLQSSLTLSKIPAASHEKSTKSQQKIPRGRNNQS